MLPPSKDEVLINTWTPTPGVTVWYTKIPDICQAILPDRCQVFFSKTTYHNSRSVVNEIFQKDDFAIPVFNGKEIGFINQFKALKKQIEFCSGRYLIKRMIHSFFLPETRLSMITLAYQDDGAPYIENLPDIQISISHSGTYAATGISNQPNRSIGLDIEKIAGKPDKYFLKTAFTQNEISHLEDNALDIFRHWTIKEAYLKFIKKGFNESLHHVEVIDGQIFHHGKKVDVRIHTQNVNDAYIMSLVSQT
jgi:4'-phosphopantetheinyl transferase